METLGEYLKNRREARKITLEEVAQVTKIRKPILEAIENNRHELLPTRVFIHGFLRTYASYLGLDESEVIKRYQEALEGLEVKEDEGEIVGKKHPQRILSPARIFVLSVIFIVALAFWFFMRPQEKEEIAVLKDGKQKASATSVEPLPITEPDISGEIGEERLTGEEEGMDMADGDRDGSGMEEKIETEQMVLRVVATDITWIKFQLDWGEPFEVLLKPGDSFRVKANKKFNLRIGNAGGIKLFLNEKHVGIPGKQGEVIDLTLPE